MATLAKAQTLTKIRDSISSKVRELRLERRWTQAQLAKHLGLSQARLSEVERGAGSFTAEQFVTILQLFNVPVSHFVDEHKGKGSDLQNALARLGARHLRESEDATPSQRDDLHGVVLRALVSDDPRLIASLAPVLVRHSERLNLRQLDSVALTAGLEHRLAWVIDNTLSALRAPASLPGDRVVNALYRRAIVVLDAYLDAVVSRERARGTLEVIAPDVLDTTIRSRKTLDAVRTASSVASKRWNIVTSIQPEDFARALQAAHETA